MRRVPIIAVAFFSLLATSLVSTTAEEQSPPTKCCFRNHSYSGICVVAPAEKETCKSILKYLNTANTVGKNYCGGSKIRGGWTQVECKEQEKEEK